MGKLSIHQNSTEQPRMQKMAPTVLGGEDFANRGRSSFGRAWSEAGQAFMAGQVIGGLAFSICDVGIFDKNTRNDLLLKYIHNISGVVIFKK
jgi:hypothetical protein